MVGISIHTHLTKGYENTLINISEPVVEKRKGIHNSVFIEEIDELLVNKAEGYALNNVDETKH